MTYTLADRAAAEGHPTLEVRRVALNDGSHASLILENGRISKLVAPSGEVARLHWEDDTPSPRQPFTATKQLPESHKDRCGGANSLALSFYHADEKTLRYSHAALSLSK